MQEVYRSFEGFLDYNCQDGYVVYDDGLYYYVQYLTVWGPSVWWRIERWAVDVSRLFRFIYIEWLIDCFGERVESPLKPGRGGVTTTLPLGDH